MSGFASLPRLVCKGSLVAVTVTAALSASTSAIDFQDVAGNRRAVMQDGIRWTASVPGPPSSSDYAQTFSFAGDTAQAGQPLTTGSVAAEPFDATLQRANRAAKGDLLFSRPHQPQMKPRIPASGAVWDLKDIFSAYENRDLPKIAFAPARPANVKNIMLAHKSFIRPEGLSRRANIMMAKVKPVRLPATPSGPVIASVETADPALVTVSAHTMVSAYAPASVDLDAPFDTLLQTNPTQAMVPVLPPHKRPGDVDMAKFQIVPQQSRPEHKWAANILPANSSKKSQQVCLARGIYFEARGEPVRGQAAVAQVILNRVKNPAYPSTICGVVYQNRKWRNRCQFSFACDGVRDRIRSSKHYKIAQQVARSVTRGDFWQSEIGDATHYHAIYVNPRWARKLTKTKRIGKHIFYRTKYGGWS